MRAHAATIPLAALVVGAVAAVGAYALPGIIDHLARGLTGS